MSSRWIYPLVGFLVGGIFMDACQAERISNLEERFDVLTEHQGITDERLDVMSKTIDVLIDGVQAVCDMEGVQCQPVP